MNEVQERLKCFIAYLGINESQFQQITGLANGFVSSTNSNMRNSSKKLISAHYPELNMDWLISGRGDMLKSDKNTINSSGANSANAIHGNAVILNSNEISHEDKRNKIPFYDDVSTIGGTNSMIANLDSNSVAEYIDTGDWFREATSAIRHYGDSMVEYPSGSILALKRVYDTNLLIWGRNYCIETTEFRITKRLQDGGENYILAYSSNTETYPDGTLIHSPIKIPKSSIRHVDLVIGCVTKEYSNNLI
ncbi:hypothetical protein [Prevotella sp. KH2C16]|uniref:hypothetical protein n=1 Tax=Prevotella sp. KH2C16 TaxID=1855325 RepID=UPI0008E0ED6D|nr:hypothetical protein [Prevotella sp. KH2C16]SFG55032.1 hypothetical protein SAMN05216383_1207 [Prevotella sp. KH2C16]